MIFENLRIGRVVMHEVFPRAEDRRIRPPRLSAKLETLSGEATGAFRLRMTDALAGHTQSLEMRITKHGPGSFLALVEAALGTSDADFLERSKAFPTKLAEAQLHRQLPGGMVVIFDGTVGAKPVPFVGAIKAETQSGFNRTKDAIEFLESIFLTPATRLYKVGIMLRTAVEKTAPDGWRAFVFDHNISKSNREAAAAYFYDTFLGCELPSDGPYETAKFFDLTKEYISRSDLHPDRKKGAIDSLHVFLKEESGVTFTTEQFSSRYLPDDMQDSYADYMRGRKFTPNAVVRDVSQMGSRLRRRRLKFGGEIELSASPEALANRISITAVEPTEEGYEGNWTNILIRGELTGEQ